MMEQLPGVTLFTIYPKEKLSVILTRDPIIENHVLNAQQLSIFRPIDVNLLDFSKAAPDHTFKADLDGSSCFTPVQVKIDLEKYEEKIDIKMEPMGCETLEKVNLEKNRSIFGYDTFGHLTAKRKTLSIPIHKNVSVSNSYPNKKVEETKSTSSNHKGSKQRLVDILHNSSNRCPADATKVNLNTSVSKWFKPFKDVSENSDSIFSPCSSLTPETCLISPCKISGPMGRPILNSDTNKNVKSQIFENNVNLNEYCRCGLCIGTNIVNDDLVDLGLPGNTSSVTPENSLSSSNKVSYFVASNSGRPVTFKTYKNSSRLISCSNSLPVDLKASNSSPPFNFKTYKNSNRLFTCKDNLVTHNFVTSESSQITKLNTYEKICCSSKPINLKTYTNSKKSNNLVTCIDSHSDAAFNVNHPLEKEVILSDNTCTNDFEMFSLSDLNCELNLKNKAIETDLQRPDNVGKLCDANHNAPDVVWKQLDKTDYQGKHLKFEGESKVNISLQSESPLNLLLNLFDDNIMKYIAKEVNYYGKILFKRSKQFDIPKSYFNTSEWQEIEKDEILTYLGILMYMDLKPLSAVKDYWQLNIWGDLEVPRHMSKDKFLTISNSLHIWNSYNITLQNTELFLNLLMKSFRKAYLPGDGLCLCESVIGLQKRLPYKANLKNKFCVKLCALRDSKNGYYLNFKIYPNSKDKTSIESDFGRKMPCVTAHEKIVCALIEPYLKCGHTLYLNRQYCSPLLALYLKGKGFTNVVGTFQNCQRQLPSNFSKLDVKVCQSVDFVGQAFESELLIQKWALKNGKCVNTMSTKHSNEIVNIKFKTCEVSKPIALVEYNSSFKRIAKFDQLLTPNQCDNKCRKGNFKFLKRMLYIAIHNAYVIHCLVNSGKTKLTASNFSKKIVEEIFFKSKATKARISNDKFLGVEHVMTSNQKSRDCWYCPRYRNVKRKKTVWVCVTCNKQLCKEPCFEEFHNKLWAGELN